MSATTDIHFFRHAASGRRAEILDAALSVFGEHGYEGGSMRGIARHVGISEPALYRHFSGKEDLFLSLVEQTGIRLRGELEPVFKDIDPAQLTHTLDTLLESRLVARAQYVPVIQAILMASAHNPRFLGAFRDSVMGPLVDSLSQLVPVIDAHFGIESNAEDTEQRVQTVIGIFMGYMLMSFVFEDEPAPISDTITRIMQWD